MDPHLFTNIMMVVMLLVMSASAVVSWGAAFHMFVDDSPIWGTVVGVLALIISLLTWSLFGLVFGWDLPVRWSIDPYPW